MSCCREFACCADPPRTRRERARLCRSFTVELASRCRDRSESRYGPGGPGASEFLVIAEKWACRRLDLADGVCHLLPSMLPALLASDDLVLVAGCQATTGDCMHRQGALHDLAERLRTRILRAHRPCGVDRRTDDFLGQAYLVTCASALQRFRGCSTLDAYLRGVVRNLTRRRRAARNLVPLSEALPDPRPPPDVAAMRNEDARRAHRVLEEMEERARTFVVLRYAKGLTYREIAERTGLQNRQQANRAVADAFAALRNVIGKPSSPESRRPGPPPASPRSG